MSCAFHFHSHFFYLLLLLLSPTFHGRPWEEGWWAHVTSRRVLSSLSLLSFQEPGETESSELDNKRCVFLQDATSSSCLIPLSMSCLKKNPFRCKKNTKKFRRGGGGHKPGFLSPFPLSSHAAESAALFCSCDVSGRSARPTLPTPRPERR